MTFVFTTLVHEPSTLVAITVVLALSVGAEVGGSDPATHGSPFPERRRRAVPNEP